MKCLDEGQLLLYLDKELSAAEMQNISRHLNSCKTCAEKLRLLSADLEKLEQGLQELWDYAQQSTVSGQAAAWDRIESDLCAKKKRRDIMKFKKAAIAAVLIIAVGLVAFVPSVRTVAANWLQVFRVEQVQVISLSPDDLASIEQALNEGWSDLDIESFGRIEQKGELERLVLSADSLGSLSFPALLPDNLDESAHYYLEKIPDIEATLEVANVNQLLANLGSQHLIPEELDGESFTLSLGNKLTYQTADYTLIQGPIPELKTNAGVDLSELYLSVQTLPIWPDSVRQQLLAINDWENTLPMPVLRGEQNVTQVRVGNTPAILTEDIGYNYRSLIWQQDGRCFILQNQCEGQLDLLEIAESLR